MRRRLKPRFEALEGRDLLSGTPLPFDDSALAPAGLQAICALPNLPVFNVHSYGATGNGVTDDTVAIRAALSAAETAGGGIIYLPTGTYAVDPQASDPVAWGSIFTITSSNIVFIGDGAGNTHLKGYVEGLKDPVTNWYVTGDSYIKIGRFSMFSVDSSASGADISNVQFRSLDINGDAGYTGDSLVGGSVATGDGWDMTHKGIMLNGSHRIDNTLVFNCDVRNWRGEEVYAGGGTNLGAIDIVNCHIYGSNASAVSATGSVLMSNSTVGGNNPGDDVYNGIEDYCVLGQSNLIEDSTIMCSSDPANLHGNGIGLIGDPAATSLTVQRCTITQNHFGILFSEAATNVLIDGNTFSNNGQAMITSILGLYSNLTTGFANFTISDNTFNSSGAAFLAQNTVTGFILNGNTVTNGCLLNGGGFAGSVGSWGTFLVENNTLGTGATDVNGYVGDNVGVWTNTTRFNLMGSAGVKVDEFSSNTTTTLHPLTDLVWLNSNINAGTQYVVIDPATLAYYPIGYQTLIYSSPGVTNWVLKADPRWNTLSADVPVGSNGVTIQVNSQGLFEVISPLATIAPVSPNPRSTAVAQMQIVFSEPVTGFTLASLSLTEDGGPNLLTSEQTLTTSDNATYTLDNLMVLTGSTGNYTLTLTAAKSGIADISGHSLGTDASASFSVNTPPEIEGVYVSGADWSQSFLNDLAMKGLGSSQLGYRLLGGMDQLAPLPWSNITTLSVTFSQDVSIDTANAGMALLGSPDLPAPPALSTAVFSYDQASHTAQWTFTSPLLADKYLLCFPSAAVVNSLDLPLDGEWTNATGAIPGSEFPSGDAVAGGDFAFRFNLLPGDTNQDGAVTLADLTRIRDVLLQNAVGATYSPFVDLNGDDAITGSDGNLLRVSYLTALPSTDPRQASVIGGQDSRNGIVAGFAAPSEIGVGTSAIAGLAVESGSTGALTTIEAQLVPSVVAADISLRGSRFPSVRMPSNPRLEPDAGLPQIDQRPPIAAPRVPNKSNQGEAEPPHDFRELQNRGHSPADLLSAEERTAMHPRDLLFETLIIDDVSGQWSARVPSASAMVLTGRLQFGPTEGVQLARSSSGKKQVAFEIGVGVIVHPRTQRAEKPGAASTGINEVDSFHGQLHDLAFEEFETMKNRIR